MAFECRGDTKLVFKDSSVDSPSRDQNPLSDSDRLVLKNCQELEKLGAAAVSRPNAKLEKNSIDPLKNCNRAFADLPSVLISEIFNFLDPKELGIVSCVSASLHRLAIEHHVWKEFYYERWGHPVASTCLEPECSKEKSWRDLFVERESRSRTFMGRYSIDTLYGHKEPVRTIFVLASKKLVFSSGYDQVVRMWDLEEGLSIASSRALGCTIRAVTADSRLLIAGGTDGFIHGWKVDEANPHLFDLAAPPNRSMEFRVWEHQGPISCLALDSSRMYSGSWDMTVRVWDRYLLKCLKVLMHNDWVWSLVPHDTSVASTAGSSLYIWETDTGNLLSVASKIHDGNAYSLARSHTGKLLFTGGEDGSIHMFEMTRNLKCNIKRIASWIPHTAQVNSLAFEFPWLVSASNDGKISLIDVRQLLKSMKSPCAGKPHSTYPLDPNHAEPPQRMLHGFGPNLLSIAIGLDRIVSGGEEGVVRIWNFSQALEIEQRIRSLRGMRLENKMRRRKFQEQVSGTGSQDEKCAVAANKNQMSSSKIGWHGKRRVSGKLRA